MGVTEAGSRCREGVVVESCGGRCRAEIYVQRRERRGRDHGRLEIHLGGLHENGGTRLSKIAPVRILRLLILGRSITGPWLCPSHLSLLFQRKGCQPPSFLIKGACIAYSGTSNDTDPASLQIHPHSIQHQARKTSHKCTNVQTSLYMSTRRINETVILWYKHTPIAYGWDYSSHRLNVNIYTYKVHVGYSDSRAIVLWLFVVSIRESSYRFICRLGSVPPPERSDTHEEDADHDDAYRTYCNRRTVFYPPPRPVWE